MGVARWGELHRRAVARGLPLPGAPARPAVFALDALTFVLSAALMVLARPRFTQPSERQGTFREIVEGGRYVAGVPWLWVTITLFAVVLMLQLAPQQVLMPKLVHDHFGRGVGAYGLLMTLVGVGTVAGDAPVRAAPAAAPAGRAHATRSSSSTASRSRRWRSRPRTRSPARCASCAALCIGFGVAAWETMLQELVPEQLLARVVSLDFFGSFGLMPVGLAIWGALAGIARAGTVDRARRARLGGDDRRRPDAALAARGGLARGLVGEPGFPRALSGCPDLNWGPLRPERSALPGCATPRAAIG